MDNSSAIEIDLGNLELEDIEVFLQEGSRGIPEFAANLRRLAVRYAAISAARHPAMHAGWRNQGTIHRCSTSSSSHPSGKYASFRA